MGVLQGADVVELDNVAALAAALDGAVTGDLHWGWLGSCYLDQSLGMSLTVNQLTW